MLKTYQFSFRGRTRFIDATDIFAAMVEFHALFNETPLTELHIIELA